MGELIAMCVTLRDLARVAYRKDWDCGGREEM